MKGKSATQRFRGFCAVCCAALALLAVPVPEFYGAEKNAIYYNKQGWEYLNRGDSFRAIVNFRNSLKQNPRYKESLVGLGKAYLATEAFDESMRLFTDVLKVERDNTESLTGMGFAMVGLGRNNDALKYFDKVAGMSEDNLEARYGMAYVYYLMDRKIWAKRKLEGILRVNPYHYKSLLLMADIKADDGRLDDAKKLIDKAVESDREIPEGYVHSGMILYRYYIKNDAEDYLDDAVEEFNRALAIQPENFQANRYMGFISLQRKHYGEAAQYFQKSLSSFPGNGITRYNLGLANEYAGDTENALASYTAALKALPSDDLIQCRTEDFLVMGDFKIGHPLRVGYSNEHMARARKKMKENLSDEAIWQLRRSLYLNPMNREAHENLMEYYHTLNYYRFYIDEMKDLMRIYPDESYQDMLNIAVIKRRDRLYQKEGFADEPPPRDVPGVLVLNLWSGGEVTAHPDAGEVMANALTFALGQYGRQDAVRLKPRLDIMKKLKSCESFLGDDVETLSDMIKEGGLKGLKYLVYGNYREGNGFLSVRLHLLDLKTGMVINEFDLSESGKDALSRLAIRAAERIYASVPYEGRVLKIADDHIVLNLGLYDGLKSGDLMVVYRYEPSPEAGKINMKKKLLFQITEADTLVSSAKPMVASDLSVIDDNEPVYPLNKRRARLIK